MKLLNTKTATIAGILLSLCASASAAEVRDIKAPVRAAAQPDLVVYYVNSWYPEADKIKVTIRNNGNAQASSSVLSVTVDGMTAEASVPSLGPNMASEREVKFSKPLTKGQKMRIVADSKNHVAESNENNNTKAHTY